MNKEDAWVRIKKDGTVYDFREFSLWKRFRMGVALIFGLTITIKGKNRIWRLPKK